MSELAQQLIAENKKTRVTYLDLRKCELTALPPEIGELPWLRALFLSRLQIADLSPLAGLTNLEDVCAESTLVTDLSPLIRLTNLRILLISRTPVADLSPLAGLNNLEQLDLWKTNVVDLHPLAGLASLRQLILSGTQVADLSPLASLTRLKVLHAARTQVADLSPLAGLSNLRQLDVSNSQVVDLSPLSSLIQRGIAVRRSSRFWEGEGIYIENCPCASQSPQGGSLDAHPLNVEQPLRGGGAHDT